VAGHTDRYRILTDTNAELDNLLVSVPAGALRD
jgi:hypothetical protein